MNTTKIMPCLDIKDGRVVKGVRFVNLRDAGDPADAVSLFPRSTEEVERCQNTI